jgi:hypothetical protein
VYVQTDSPFARPGPALVRKAILLATTLAGAAWLAHKGPVPVIRITTPLPERAPFWYMLLAFPVLGMLVADLFDLWRARGISLPTVELGLDRADRGPVQPPAGHPDSPQQARSPGRLLPDPAALAPERAAEAVPAGGVGAGKGRRSQGRHGSVLGQLFGDSE